MQIIIIQQLRFTKFIHDPFFKYSICFIKFCSSSVYRVLTNERQKKFNEFFGLYPPDKFKLQLGLKLLDTAENFLEHLLLNTGEFLGIDIIVR